MAPAEAGHEASTEGALPCFPLPLQRAALPWSKRTLNIMESRWGIKKWTVGLDGWMVGCLKGGCELEMLVEMR